MTRKTHRFWNHFWIDFGAMLEPFWEPWDVHGSPFWCKNRTLAKDPCQNGGPKPPGASLLAPWSPQGLPKCPQDPQKTDFLRILVPRRAIFYKKWADDHLFVWKICLRTPRTTKTWNKWNKKCPRNFNRSTPKVRMVDEFWWCWTPEGPFLRKPNEPMITYFCKNLSQNTQNHGNPKQLKQTINAPETLIVEGRRQWR